MPIDYDKYPNNWKTEIRPAILERAENKCEWCGLPDGEHIWRNQDDNSKYIRADESNIDYCFDQDGTYYHWDNLEGLSLKSTKIILTIAHIENPDPMDCRPENLAALCQRCHHLSHDTPAHRAYKRKLHDEEVGQLRMFD